MNQREATTARPPRPSNRLPYFDPILEKLQEGDADFVAVSGRHVHWGYWPNPAAAHGTLADWAVAQEVMSVYLCDQAGIVSGQSVLDAGCGFGGTLASLNERLDQMTLLGVNIDERQLERAQAQVVARTDNSVRFIQANACELPLASASVDSVLAVECIMHFPSRLHFFQEARRVLRPGGRLTVSDFCPIRPLPNGLMSALAIVRPTVNRSYGQTHLRTTVRGYRSMARRTGFRPVLEDDITANAMPTYPAIYQFLRRDFGLETDLVTRVLEWSSRLGLVRYMILSYQAV
jgi:ubiquinone/menaquinone biosynthesis C-methylase UbiE